MLPRIALPLLVGTLALAAGCASAPRGPPAPYTTGIDPRFPGERYVVGVGEGVGLEAARRQATMAIAAQLRARLRASEVIEATDRTGHRDGVQKSHSSESVSQDIRVDVHFDRPGWIRFVDSHVEKGRTWVLAVLDRREVAGLLEAEIQAHRTRLTTTLDTLEAEENPRRLADALVPLRKETERLATARELWTTLERRPLPPPSELRRVDELEAKLERIRANVRLAVCVESSRGGAAFGGQLESLLAGEGIPTVSCDSEESTLRLTGTLRAHAWSVPPQPGAWTRFCTVGLDWRIVGADGWNEGGSDPGQRTGGATEAEACANALRTLAHRLGQGLGLSGERQAR